MAWLLQDDRIPNASRLVPRLVQFSNESGVNATTNSDSMRSVRLTHRCGRILDRFPPRVGALARVFRGIEISFRRLKRAQLEALVFRPFRHAISTLAPQWRRGGPPMRPHCPSRENFALWKLLENVQHRWNETV